MTTTVEHAAAQGGNRLATAGHNQMSDLGETIATARIEAGRLLACLRHAAGLSQVQLARRIGYSATVVAHAELGRRPVSAEFWELADGALAADGELTAQGIRIRDLATTRREEQRRRDMARHTQYLPQLLTAPHDSDDTVPAVPTPPALGVVATSATAKCPYCNHPVTLITRIAAPPDTST
jgi:transcriptional regulator with XRE-family HTH domain